jgi:selenocysteine-specific elongation factor
MTYVIGTAGHVDHGKSTLVEALTGIDPDRLAEEKEREMTIDLGFAWLTLPQSGPVGIVDVPGHRDFIENMLAGVGGIDLALFVVAADEGIMPQTREHLAILDLLDIPGGIVALTKADLIDDPEWIDLVSLDVADLLIGTALEDAPIIPVSARSGAGLDDLLAALDETLAGRPPRPDRGRPRLPVDRVFTISGFGTVVTGTLVGGTLAVDDEVEVVPGGRRARVRGLQSHKEGVERAQPGGRTAVNLSGIDTDEIRRGQVVALPGVIEATTLVDVRFRHLQNAGRSLKHNAEVKFFSGAAETLAHARVLAERELMPGAEGWLQLRLSDPVALDAGDRFILRYPSPPQTIGGGQVLDPHPPYRWRRFKPEVIERFQVLASGTPADLVLHALEEALALLPDQLPALTNLSAEQVAEAVEALAAGGELIALPGGWWMARARWERLSGQIEQELARYHQANPLQAGMQREMLRRRLGVEGKLFGGIVAFGGEVGLLADEGTAIRLAGHEIRFSATQQAQVEALFDRIAANPTAPPVTKEAGEMVGDEVLGVLFDRGELIPVSGEVFFDPQTYEELVAQVEAYIGEHGSITVAQARDRFGTSRRYVLALLEHLDSIGFTRREGDARVLSRSPG